ncbi:hypothetical protein ACWFRB_09185 [Rhodococcus sp. NPDC055112]
MPPRTRKPATTKPSQATGEPTEAEVTAALDVLDKTDAELEALALVDDDENPIPDELQFTTGSTPTVDRSEAEAEVLSVDGHELIAFKPEPAAWNLLIGAMSKSATASDKAYAVMDLVNHVFDDASLMYIKERLMARGDSFDQAFLEKIVVSLIKRWTPDLNRAQRRASARARR